MKEPGGTQKPPKVFELPITVPSARISGARKIASSFRLLVDGEMDEIAVATQDELSGRSWSLTLKMNP